MNKKILIIADPYVEIPPQYYGGVERIVNLLACGLKSRNWDVTLACKKNSTCHVSQVHLNDSKNYQYQRIINISKIAFEILTNDYDIIHSFANCDLTACLWPSGRRQIQSFQSLPSLSTLKKRIEFFSPKSLRFTTCGYHMIKHLEHLAPTSAIHNGVNIADFTYQETVRDDAPLVFLGRIEEIKGTHLAIQVAKATGRKLVIAGNRSNSDSKDVYFREQVEPHLCDSITYIGQVNDSQKNLLLGSAAAFLMPIQWDEPFGIVMAEALACGTPVIGYSRGALPEIVNDGVTGACCNTIEEMIAAVSNIKKYNRQQCRREAEERFSSDKIVEQYVTLYEKILSGNNF